MTVRTVSRRMFLGLATEQAPAAGSHIGPACLTFQSIACECCLDACEPRAIVFTRTHIVKRPLVDAERCTGCGECVAVCPVGAIQVTQPHV